MTKLYYILHTKSRRVVGISKSISKAISFANKLSFESSIKTVKLKHKITLVNEKGVMTNY